MKKISFVSKVRYLGFIAIVMQGILFALLTIYFMNEQYLDKWSDYPGNGESVTVYLKNVSSKRQTNVEQYLYNIVEEQQLFVVRRDSVLKNDGTFSGYKVGVYGYTDRNNVSLIFWDQQILNADNLKKLLSSQNKNSTLGIEKGSIDSVGYIPSFRFGEQVIVKKLSQLISESKTVNGTYSILGIESNKQKNRFISKLSEVSGVSEQDLINKTSGETKNNNLKKVIIIGFIFAQLFFNAVFFLVITIKNLSKQGKVTLLGWSRISFCSGVLGQFLIFAVINIPVQIIIGWLLTGWNTFSSTIFSYFAMSAVINIILVMIELLISAIVILMIKPLDAIHKRIPKRPLYILGILAYMAISVGIMFCGSYVDKPLQSLSENAKLSRRWKNVSEFQILRNISVGQDTDSFTGQSKQLDQDIFNWYKSIADREGVYLVNTTYYNNEVLELWNHNDTYAEIPEKPFWYFTASPNYIKELRINLNTDIISQAKNGARIYLIPSTMSNTEQEKLIKWLKESVTKEISFGDIPTTFNEIQKFQFITYNPKEKLFTWATELNNATEDAAPVIYVCTPENMSYFESESLKATGIEGYIKFANTDIMNQYTEDEKLSKFNLSDNDLVFAKVQDYIDGIQKEIMVTIIWFGLVFAILIIILIGLLLALASIFRIANQEKINVKKFLGFSFGQLYRCPIIALMGIIVLEIITMLVLRSKFGLLLIVIVDLLQIMIFTKYMARCELKQLLSMFKG
ncbi:MAG: hypothetical protein ACLRZ9_00310 [Eubacterium sp.]